MGVGKTQLKSNSAIDATLGIAGKTISTVTTFRHGTTEVLDILCTDTVHYFTKFSQGQVEVGGTADWGTGTMVGGR